MKILLITNSYRPEIRSTSQLMYELASELRDKEIDVTVLTSFPGYNLAEKDVLSKLKENMDEEGITVLRAKTLPLKNIGYIKRGIAEITSPLVFWKLLMKYSNNYDVIWVYSPPLPLAILGIGCKLYFKSKMILNVQDIFPQNAIDIGVLKNKFIIHFYQFLEKAAYRFADKILVHSEKNRDYLIQNKNVPELKIIKQYNWIDTNEFEKASKTGKFRKEYDLTEDDIIVLYAGVMGPSQGLKIVIHLAKHFKKDKNLKFLMVGDGIEKEKLMKEAKNYSLDNIIFKPFVSKGEYPFLVKDADIGMTCLSHKVKTPVVPGKIQGYMAAGRPVLAILNKESDGHILVKRAEAGKTANTEETDKVIQALEALLVDSDLRTNMGMNGYKYAVKHLEKKTNIDKIYKHVIK